MQRRNILVVGAGPVGSVAALAAARFGHSVTLLEALQRIDDSPRASTTQPPTLEILAQLGLVDEYIRVGLTARTFEFWDRPTLERVAKPISPSWCRPSSTSSPTWRSRGSGACRMQRCCWEPRSLQSSRTKIW
jgi:2-polyprenyl-6-methoxyphenol hydroxylase-like FAD-dependent oxidoreductase